MNNQITLSQALEGYELAFKTRHLSSNTLAEYKNTFRKFCAFLEGDDPLFKEIDQETIEKFLAAQTVSNKTILNYHTGLSALWTWAVKDKLVPENPLHSITRPKPGKPDIIPLTEADMRALLAAVTRSKPYATRTKKMTSNTLPDADRNRAILLVLLDTGIRASEVCHLRIKDVDLRNKDRSIHVKGGKGDKDRALPISPRTAQAIWKYLTTRPDSRLDQALFASDTGRMMDRNNLGNMIAAAGERASVPDAHPHRFRHTFAINYLRNGGDIYTLQWILGHETLEMCLRYLAIAKVDVDNAHRIASPVDHWAL